MWVGPDVLDEVSLLLLPSVLKVTCQIHQQLSRALKFSHPLALLQHEECSTSLLRHMYAHLHRRHQSTDLCLSIGWWRPCRKRAALGQKMRILSSAPGLLPLWILTARMMYTFPSSSRHTVVADTHSSAGACAVSGERSLPVTWRRIYRWRSPAAKQGARATEHLSLWQLCRKASQRPGRSWHSLATASTRSCLAAWQIQVHAQPQPQGPAILLPTVQRFQGQPSSQLRRLKSLCRRAGAAHRRASPPVNVEIEIASLKKCLPLSSHLTRILIWTLCSPQSP